VTCRYLADSLSQLAVLAATSIDTTVFTGLPIGKLLAGYTQANSLDRTLPSLRDGFPTFFTIMQTFTPVQLLPYSSHRLIDTGVDLILYRPIP
jgi:hypothetical protein